MTTCNMPPADPAHYLAPTWFIDSDSPAVVDFAQQAVGSETGDVARALRLFYAVRDQIRYSAYGIGFGRENFRASHVFERGHGWCVTKSCLLAAVARAVGLPCRLGYANVRNHLATEKLLRWMGTDVFYFHGYNEFYLEGRWVKSTVAFNRSLCEKAGLHPLDWDGRHDSLYHPFDIAGRQHMEYLHDWGPYEDVPYEQILAKFAEVYPNMRVMIEQGTMPSTNDDFEAEIAAETTARQQSPSPKN